MERFGPGIVAADGTLDRQAVADIVFNDADALKDLGAIVHPAVGAEIAARLEAAAGHRPGGGARRPAPGGVGPRRPGRPGGGRRRPGGRRRSAWWQQRGMREDDARARMANQASREDRLARADVVLDNSGTVEDLARQIDALWPRLVALGSDT